MTLSRTSSLLASITVGLIVVRFIPFRVADCGPADPHLLRYFGAPLFNQTGIGVASSLEATVWLLPTIINVIIIAIIVLSAIVLVKSVSRPKTSVSGRYRAVPITLAISAILLSSAIVWAMFEADDVIIAMSTPDVSTANCEIGFTFFANQNAWQTQ